MTSITIPNSVTSIEAFAFCDCSGLVSITIPNSVTGIGAFAFYNCSALTTIIIGNSVKTIGGYAFGHCHELTDVYCYAVNVPGPIILDDDGPFTTYFMDSYIEYATLHVPASAIDEYKKKEPWNGFKSIVKIDMPEYTLTYMVDGDIYKSYKVEEGASITPEPNLTKEGYTFSGWSEIPETMPANDVTITGTFTINTYKLTYMIDNNVYKEVEYEYGAAITPEPQPEGDYQTFEWTDLPQTMPAHDVVVYASYTSGIIDLITTSQCNIRIYSLNGQKHNKQQKGLNIVVLDDGTVKRIVIK